MNHQVRRLPALVPAVVAAVVAVVTAATLGLPGTSAARVPDPGVDRGPASSVLVVSVDGLNPRALTRLGSEGAPHLHRLMAQGASTLNARTAVEMTVTLPNHTAMVTGRRIDADSGGHGVVWNDDRVRPRTVQAAAGEPVDSLFSVVADDDGSAALFASKTKFSLWQRSWRDDLDRVVIEERNARLVRTVLDDLRETDRELRFLHLSAPDAAGHDRGFMSARYLVAVRRVDRWVGRLMDAVDQDVTLRDSTALLLTADHGGSGSKVHDARRDRDNYRVPFMVRGPGVTPGADLYGLNDDYADPGRSQPGYGAVLQPVRNGMVANVALDLLGLGPVPGSLFAVEHDLDVSADD